MAPFQKGINLDRWSIQELTVELEVLKTVQKIKVCKLTFWSFHLPVCHYCNSFFQAVEFFQRSIVLQQKRTKMCDKTIVIPERDNATKLL